MLKQKWKKDDMWKYRGGWKQTRKEEWDYDGDFRIVAMGDIPIKISAILILIDFQCLFQDN